MFKSLYNLTKDVVEIAAAPVEVAADLTRIATKPVADLAKEAKEVVSEATNEATRKG